MKILLALFGLLFLAGCVVNERGREHFVACYSKDTKYKTFEGKLYGPVSVVYVDRLKLYVLYGHDFEGTEVFVKMTDGMQCISN